MKVYQYSITLHSDAQPGTGLGGETVNDYVPRDMQGRPFCPGAHIKGLMREALLEIFKNLELDPAIVYFVLGCSFDVARLDAESSFQITDAVAQGEKSTIFVSRTALDEYGTAKDTSLRTNEAIRTGTVFQGKIISNVPAGSLEETLWQLGLLSIFAIGGSRNRGCGQCTAQIQKLNAQPADLLCRLVSEVPAWNPPAENQNEQAVPAFTDSERWIPVRLTFTAETPVCVPATAAAVRTNVQTTDFSIPASAVRGMIVRRFQAKGRAFMDQLFESSKFIVWPLQPCAVVGEKTNEIKPNSPISIRVSLTHRAAKFSVEKSLISEFEDKAWEEEILQNAAPKAPMKASDGVLLIEKRETKPQLWKAKAMPHDVRSHGVHHNEKGGNERGLYTVDSMAPMIWRGLAVLPESIAQELIKSFADCPETTFGTRRSVQGMGKLMAEILTETPVEWILPSAAKHTVFIVQSPITIPEGYRKDSADEQLRKMVEVWLQKNDLSISEIKVWANTGILFGWNVKLGGQQPPRVVILPGSVIQFPEKLSQETIQKLLSGGFFIDETDPQCGYGAVSVHPGKAAELFTRQPEPKVLKASEKRKAIAQKALEIFHSGKPLPSSSQIGSLRKLYMTKSLNEVKEFFDVQCSKDGSWEAWKSIQKEIREWLGNFDRENVLFGLELLTDLILTKKNNQ